MEVVPELMRRLSMSEVSNEVTTEAGSENSAPQFDRDKYERVMAELEAEQNFPMGFFAGLIAAAIGAAVWAAIAIITNYNIGWIAIGIGALVGVAIQKFGKGTSMKFGILGAILALLGCMVGNLATVYVAVNRQLSMSFADLINIYPPIDVLKSTFQGMDLLFYGLALFAGYSFSFRKIDEKKLQEMMAE